MIESKNDDTVKLRVAFCIPNMIIGGVETVFVNTIDELSKNPDLDIKIITSAKIREPLYANWLKTHPEIPVYTYYPLCNWFEDLAPKCHGLLKPIRKILFSLYKKYRRLLVATSGRFRDIDVFVDYKNFDFFKELKYFHKPKIAWAHSAFSYFESNGIFTRLPQYTKIVGITDDFVNDFKARYPKYAHKIIRIYNPMNFDNIHKKAKLDEPPHGKYFCHVSRLVQGKDIKTLLNAFDLFASIHPDVQLHVVGDGYMSDELQEYAKTLKSNQRIVFTGAMRNPYGIMSGAIANILSSEFEGLPTVVLESVILGVPCISSNCKNGPHEILLDGDAGLLFDIGNANQLCQHMCNVYTNSIDKQTMVKNMQNSIARFAQDVIAKQIHDVIFDTVKGA